MHRGAVWASGAAQAAQFVRIILRWRGVCRAFASRGRFGELKKSGFSSRVQAAATNSSLLTHSHRGGHDEICDEIASGGGAEQYHADKKYKEAVADAVEELSLIHI